MEFTCPLATGTCCLSVHQNANATNVGLRESLVIGAPSVARPHHLTKRERLAIQGDPKVVMLIDMRERLADLFKGVTYKGPYVKITHKQAFEARKLKRAAKALANVAMETVQI